MFALYFTRYSWLSYSPGYKTALAINQRWLWRPTQTQEINMERNTVILFTRFGMGDGPAELQQILAAKYLSLLLESGDL